MFLYAQTEKIAESASERPRAKTGYKKARLGAFFMEFSRG